MSLQIHIYINYNFNTSRFLPIFKLYNNKCPQPQNIIFKELFSSLTQYQERYLYNNYLQIMFLHFFY
jgi:hypothetical protein